MKHEKGVRLEIRQRGVQITEELRTYLKARLWLALGRFTHCIDRVRVYLRDVNGPRGGLGRKCRMVVEIPPRGRIIVVGTDAVLSRAIVRTAGRMRFALKRYVQRRRTRYRPARRRIGQMERFAAASQ